LRVERCRLIETTGVTQNPARGTAGAGALLIGAILGCAGIGLALGALLGAEAPLAIAGGAVGVVVGFRIVYRRFKDI
jgi:hypothetical protein